MSARAKALLALMRNRDTVDREHDLDLILDEAGAPERVRLFRTSDQVITTGAVTDLIFEEAQFDNDNFFDLAGEPTRITIRTAGVYIFGAGINWSNTNAGGSFRVLRIDHNSLGRLVRFDDVRETATFPIGNLPMAVTGMMILSVDDFLTLKVQHNAGGDLTINDSAESSINFWAHRLSN